MGLFNKNEPEITEDLSFMGLYTIKDNLNGFIPPIPFPNEDVAIRWFGQQMKENPAYNYSPSDYDFYYLGSWNFKTGNIIYSDSLTRIVKRGAEYGNRSED